MKRLLLLLQCTTPEGNAMPHRPDLWLTPAQATYFLFTGKDLAEVARLSEAVVVGRLAHPPRASVPLSTEAGPEEHAAAFNALREQLRHAGESPSLAATKWRDQLLAAGLTTAQGRRAPSMPYVTINPVEFCHLTIAGPHAENARGGIVFYDIHISGWDLWQVRRAVASDIASVELKPAGASSPQDPQHPVEERPDADESVRAVQASESIPTSTEKKNGDAIRRRSAYRSALEAWMARQDLGILQKMEPAAIAREFKTHCEQRLPELISLLPKRLRSMEHVIETIIERRRAKAVRLRSANKSQ